MKSILIKKIAVAKKLMLLTSLSRRVKLYSLTHSSLVRRFLVCCQLYTNAMQYRRTFSKDFSEVHNALSFSLIAAFEAENHASVDTCATFSLHGFRLQWHKSM